jgi:hypothetical protein
LAVLGTACSAPATGPAVGSLEVRAATVGKSPDADGYRVGVDGMPARPLGSNETLVFLGLTAGSHEVAVSGVASNCSLDGDPVRAVTVDAGETVALELVFTCRERAGTIQVRTASSGEDLDPSGYTLLVDGARVAAMSRSGLAETMAPEGEHTVELAGLSANCTIAGDNPRPVTVLAGATVSTTFSVTCDPVEAAGPGGQIAFATTGADTSRDIVRIALMNSDGTHLRPFSEFGDGATWSPDGAKVAVSGAGAGLVVGPVDEAGVVGQTTGITDGEFAVDAAWSPAGGHIAYFAGNSGTDGTDLVVIEPGGEGRRVLTELVEANNEGRPAWSPDAQTIAYSLFDELRLVDFAGTNDRSFADPALQGIDPSWSPDGTRIAIAGRGAGLPGHDVETLDYDIYVVPVDGGAALRLTDSPGDDGAPSWSPDGSKIVFVSHRDGNAEIYLMDADGSNHARLTDNPGLDSSPVWRPGGPPALAIPVP